MDKKGYELIKKALVGPGNIYPEPEGDENVRYLGIVTAGSRRPATILNWLSRDGLLMEGQAPEGDKPMLKLIGQSAVAGERQGDLPLHYLTFEDMACPNSLRYLL